MCSGDGEVFTGDEMKHWCTCTSCSERSRQIDEAAARKRQDEAPPFTPEYVYCRTCGEHDDSRVIHNHPERHEFHMNVNSEYRAYCICGWQTSEDEFLKLGKRYREHLENPSLQHPTRDPGRRSS